MTETMLDRVARATETYAVVFTEKALVYKTDTIGARMTKVVGEFDTAQEAKEACKRMNARAVLEVLMEPTEEMIEAALKPVPAKMRGNTMLVGHPAPQWQAMIRAILKYPCSPRRGGNDG